MGGVALWTSELRSSTQGDADVVDITAEGQVLIDFDDRPRERTVVVQISC